MTIYPTYNEVHHGEKPFLHPSIVAGRYKSTSIYLDTHFWLLREDFVRPLREGILELLQSFEDKGLTHGLLPISVPQLTIFTRYNITQNH